MAGNNGVHRGPQKDKPFRDALRAQIAAAGEDFKLLRKVAQAHLDKALEGDMAAIRELADRLDGKVPQALVGDDDHPPLTPYAEWLSWMKSQADTGHANNSGPSTNGFNGGAKSWPTAEPEKP